MTQKGIQMAYEAPQIELIEINPSYILTTDTIPDNNIH